MPRLRILVVDDELALREVLLDLLELEGHEVLVARDGMEALEMLETTEPKPDLILLDQMMPRLRGDQLLEILKTRGGLGAIPVILISAAHDAQAIASGHGVPLLRKPLDADALLKAIDKAR